jgi:hypothetical protein
VGAVVKLVALQLSALGWYLPPVLKGGEPPTNPPQTIISLPVHTAVCSDRGLGALNLMVVIQLSVLGLYFPPLFVNCSLG